MPRRKGDEIEQLGHSERSRYAAHLDRGWHLFEKGDFDAASASAAHAQELSDRLPDASMLEGAAAGALGNLDGALAAYELAIERDPEYLAAYLAAGQLLCFDLNRPQDAIDLLSDAGARNTGLAADCLELELLCSEADWLLGRRENVRERMDALDESDEIHGLREAVAACQDLPGQPAALAGAPSEDDAQATRDAAVTAALLDLFGGAEEFELDPGELPSPDEAQELQSRAAMVVLRIARAWLDLDEPKRALFWAHGLVAFAVGEADAWHLLAEARYRSNDTVGSVHAAVQAYRLDTRDGAPGWAPGAGELHAKVQTLLANCKDPRIQALVQSAAFIVLIHEAPALELVLEGVDARAPAITLSSGGRKSSQDLTGVAVYRRNIARMCRGLEDFDNELRIALFGELATALAIDDAGREALGLPPAITAR